MLKMINIGFGATVASDRVISILRPESAPIKRMIQEARESNRLIDATYGRKTRGVIVTDSNHIIITGIHPETITSRFNNEVDNE